jgi:regulator of protease activity HflC (stomatin/prohibitin superfamily)
MKSKSLFGGLIFFVILVIGLVGAYAAYNPVDKTASIAVGIGAFILALLIPSAIKIADPWDKAVVLRLGQFRSLRGPGLFLIGPIHDTIPYWIDTRVITTSFKAEKTLTKDTVPVEMGPAPKHRLNDKKAA